MTTRSAAVILAVLAAAYAVGSLLAVALFLGLIAVAARVVPRTVLARLEVERRHPPRLFHGEEAEVEIRLLNRSRLGLPWVWITDAVPFDLSPRSFRWATTLAAGETRSRRFSLAGSRRGIYRLGPATMVTGDLFGLQPAQRADSDTGRLVVYPRIVPLHRLGLPARAPFPELRTNSALFEDPYRMVGIRPYAPGDSARRIHWAASAHQGSLVVRKLENGIGRDTMVLLDLSRDGLGTTRSAAVELAVTAAASVVHHIITVEGLRAGLRLAGVSLPPDGDQAHLMAMLELLAGASASTGSARLDDPVGLPFGASILLIVGRLDDRWTSSLVSLRHRGWHPSVLWLGDSVPVVPSGIPVRRITADRQLAIALAAMK
jgi:uncharacterized protein (DUF58 family)